MIIWYNKQIKLPDLDVHLTNNMCEHLDIRFEEIGDDFLKASMPVDHRTIQPYGLLHGGASAALAETLGSMASMLVINPQKLICVGIEINANHIRSATTGRVMGTCTPIHIGASTHVWDIRIHDEKKKLVCISRLTVAVLKKR